MAVSDAQLLHYGRLDRSPMSESGTGLGYLVLFTEIGFTLLVTTLLGALGGYWLDERLGTAPLLGLIGFLAGAGIGTYGIYKLVSRFLATIE
jgi:ATP synthase protein I